MTTMSDTKVLNPAAKREYKLRIQKVVVIYDVVGGREGLHQWIDLAGITMTAGDTLSVDYDEMKEHRG